MAASQPLVFSRTRVKQRYALFPIGGYPPSKLPDWPETEARILAAPALGAEFSQYLLKVPAKGASKVQADGRVETFFYVLDGEFKLSTGGKDHRMTTGGFALLSPKSDYSIDAAKAGTLLMLKKAYEPLAGHEPPPLVVGNENDIKGEIYMGDDGALLKTLIPDELKFDLAMNIFTFEVGHGLPYVETHVMEHGLYFLQGKGLYYLDDTWMEVEATDFIWMGPYVPQSYYATGPVASRYIYYKNVNRDVRL